MTQARFEATTRHLERLQIRSSAERVLVYPVVSSMLPSLEALFLIVSSTCIKPHYMKSDTIRHYEIKHVYRGRHAANTARSSLRTAPTSARQTMS